MCFKNAKYVINKLITYICSFKNAFHMGSIGFGPIDGNVGYFKRIEKDYIISVSEAVSLTRNYANINITPIEGTQVRFSVTLYDVAAYYGAFTNPPALKSPDVLPSNVFEVSGTQMKNINSVTTKNIGWYRLLRFVGGVFFQTTNSKWLLRTRHLHTYYFCPGYHAIGSTKTNMYDSHKIELGFTEETENTNIMHFTVETLSIAKSANWNGSAYSKFRVARGQDLDYWSAQTGQTALTIRNYSVYLEAYYSINVQSSQSFVYVDNIITPGIARIDNNTNNPDGNDDILIGSEVTPTIIGTSVTVS